MPGLSLRSLPTAPVVAAGLIGGFALAQAADARALGGVVLLASTALSAPSWLARAGWPTALGLAAVQWGSMGLSHPLAQQIGAWPSVITVAGVSAAAAYLASDRRPLPARHATA